MSSDGVVRSCVIKYSPWVFRKSSDIHLAPLISLLLYIWGRAEPYLEHLSATLHVP